MKSSNDERLFKEKRTNLKYKKGNRFYTTHEGDYKGKSYPNPHTNLVFFSSDVGLIKISILCLILLP